MNEKIDLLRHTLATVAYRAEKALRDAPDGFAAFRANERTRTPLEILAHCGDLYDWALTMTRGEAVWRDAEPQAWEAEVARFFEALRKFDEALAAAAGELPNPVEKLFQGPVADSLTHIGQINLLRGMFEMPVKGESYYRAEIEIGRVGRDQSAKRVEF